MNVVHTIAPGGAINEGYFHEDNITFILNKINEVLRREFKQYIVISRGDIIMVMQYMLNQRRENVPKMNQRVVMYICDDFRNHQYQADKVLRWEETYTETQKLIDHAGQISRFDQRAIKTNDQKKWNNQTKVGGTLQFYFT
jgi:intracellular sulfur oxidation DsrE/DsrF family protein